MFGLAATAFTLLTGAPPRAGRTTAARPRYPRCGRGAAPEPGDVTDRSSRARGRRRRATGRRKVRTAPCCSRYSSSPSPAATSVATSVADAALTPSSLIVAGGVAAITVAVGFGRSRRRRRDRRLGRVHARCPAPPLPRAHPPGTPVQGLERVRAPCRTRPVPLRQRLARRTTVKRATTSANIGRSVEAGVRECWTVAKRIDALERTVLELDLDRARERLVVAEADLHASPSPTRKRARWRRSRPGWHRGNA